MDQPVGTDAAADNPSTAVSAGRPRRELSLWDSVSIIVGIIVGVGIFKTAPFIASCAPSVSVLLLLWAAGGVLSVIGAVCYAELATAYPREGGDYVYLNHAYGDWAGFLFAWARMSIIQTGSIGAAAYVFATYATDVHSLGSQSHMLYAAGAVIALSLINILGAREGKWTQNLLTVAKVLGLAAILGVAFCFTGGPSASPPAPSLNWNLPTAMVLVLYTYGGWNEAAYVAAEVRNPQRNIVRALLVGTCFVTLLYLAVNGAYLKALGLGGLQQTNAVAGDVVARAFAPAARTGDAAHAGAAADSIDSPQAEQTRSTRLPAIVMSLLVMVSALGAINGEIFTGARISYAVGCEHRAFAALGRWGKRSNSPLWALVAQGAVTFGLVVFLGGHHGGQAGFDTLVAFAAPVFWTFFFLTAVSLFVLRWREPHVARPYRVPVFPLVPLVFCLSCAFMLYSSVTYAISLGMSNIPLYTLGILLLGIPLYVISRRFAEERAPNSTR
jgi:APA family basic amino acid/polyamine antiporter